MRNQGGMGQDLPGSSAIPTAPAFRRDIQGLRAVAVGVVVAYHAGVPVLPGGYVGVDIFFVISGYLITGHLNRELAVSGRIIFTRFYARRARRLLPAALVVLVVTLFASRILVPPLAWPDISRAGAATALYAGNVFFAHAGTDYLAAETSSPFLHYWSLGVEEQFYCVWPLLLLAMAALAHATRRRYVVVVCVASVAGLSLLLCVWLTQIRQPWAFFLLPTRAWEFAAGGALVFLPLSRTSTRPAVSSLLGWLGMAGIITSAAVFDDSTLFPGTASVIPVISTLGVIVAGATATRRGPARMLEVSPLRCLGDISYSLYLWHWPLLTIPFLGRPDTATPWARGALVTLAVFLAAATYRFVEQPGRRRNFWPRRDGRTLVLVCAVTAAAVAGSLAAGKLPRLDFGSAVAARQSVGADALAGATRVPPNLTPSLQDASADVPQSERDGCLLSLSATDSPACVYGDAKSSTSVVLFGDSHASQWFPAFEVLAEEHDWRLTVLTKSSCPSVDVTVRSERLGRTFWECDQWRDKALKRIAQEKPAAVVVANFREHRLDESSPRRLMSEWTEGMRRTRARLPVSSRMVVLADTPRFKIAPPLCLSGALARPQACVEKSSQALESEYTDVERSAALLAGAGWVDLNDQLCTPQWCQVMAGPLLIYRDSHHLTATVSRALAPQLDARLTLPG
jgi:peptidoglycan/LPS O-acetylase OafA/YrhL